MKLSLPLRLSILLLFIPVICNSQPTKFQVAIEGGPALSMVSENGWFFSKNSIVSVGLGGAVGAVFRYNFTPKTGIGTGLYYERKGWQNRSGSYHDMYDYLTWSVLFRANIGKKNLFFVDAGPWLGFLLAHRVTLDGQNFPQSVSEFDPYDFGLTIAAGVNIPVSKQLTLTFGLKDNLGLHDIHNGDADAKTFLNSAIVQVGFGYSFGKYPVK